MCFGRAAHKQCAFASRLCAGVSHEVIRLSGSYDLVLIYQTTPYETSAQTACTQQSGGLHILALEWDQQHVRGVQLWRRESQAGAKQGCVRDQKCMTCAGAETI